MSAAFLFDAPEARAPEAADLFTRVAKADIRLCRGLNRKYDQRLTLIRQDGEKYVLGVGHERWFFDAKLITSILDGAKFPFGDRWFERRK